MTGELASDDRAPEFPALQRVMPGAAFDWLAAGWRDLVATRFAGIVYGVVFAAMGIAISIVYATYWQLTMGLIGGFFLLGPFVATGLYELSRRREAGESIGLVSSLTCWRRNPGSIALFAVILAFVMIVWARVSVILFALSSNTSFPTVQDMLWLIVSLDNLPFLGLWAAVGALFATLVFAISVVAVPMMLDRDSDTLTAVFTSVRALIANPLPMLVWASVIVAVIGLSLLAGFLPLVLTGPLVGHATWHAYRATVASPVERER